MSSLDLILTAAANSLDPDTRSHLYTIAADLSLTESIKACTRCPLHLSSKQRVPWSGNKSAVALVGEAPGADEDTQGFPFVGRAGAFLDRVLSSIGVARDEVALINTICCRPPGNDFDKAREVGAVESCSPWFDAQLRASGAWFVVPMGNAALSKYRAESSIGQWRGKGWWDGGHYIYPTYHPAYGLRNPAAGTDISRDLKPLRAILDGEFNLPPPTAPPFIAHDPKLQSHFKRKGWVAVWSSVLGCQLVMVRNDKVKVPPFYTEYPRYYASEIVKLAGTTPEFKRQAHTLKMAFGAEVVT